MTVSADDRRADVVGDASTLVFAYDFLILANTDMKVYHVDNAGATTLLTLTTDYTVSNVGVGGGGNVTLTSAYDTANGKVAADESILMIGDTAKTQLTNLLQNGAYNAEVQEAIADKLTLIINEFTRERDRSLRLALSDDSATVSTLLPVVAASEILAVNAAGTAFEFLSTTDLGTIVPSTYMLTLLDDANAAAARTTLGVEASGLNVPLAGGTMTGNLVMAAANVNVVESLATDLTASVTQTLAGALKLTKRTNIVTTVGTTSDAVGLPEMPVGGRCTIINTSATALAVWPDEDSSDSIDDGSVDAVDANTLSTGMRTYVKETAANWVTETNAPATASVVGDEFFIVNSGAQSNFTGNGTTATVVLDSEIKDAASNFASNTFTADATGTWLLFGGVRLSGIVSGHQIGKLDFVTSNRTFRIFDCATLFAGYGSVAVMQGACIADFDLSDTCTMAATVESGAKVVDISSSGTQNGAWFGGVRIA
jgi:hypothetical protein